MMGLLFVGVCSFFGRSALGLVVNLVVSSKERRKERNIYCQGRKVFTSFIGCLYNKKFFNIQQWLRMRIFKIG